VLCRYAGDRFALILPNTGRAGAEKIAGEISAAVQHFAYKPQNQDESLFHSVSIGIALTSTDTTTRDSAETLIERANLALLHAKEKHHATLQRAA
jgi:diguanylate cyclase (GGDEF)-like protein